MSILGVKEITKTQKLDLLVCTTKINLEQRF